MEFVGIVLKMKVNCFDATCSRCRIEDESHLHLFRDCTTSVVIWNMLLQNFKLINDRGFLQS